ncbi:MAG: hypothetical protein LBQ87_07150 [Candidatus Fibromonas sp.]|jgi:hypothetical protein|nr:hypothetical protein [Candidatus Fibromonas sp.]
MPSKKPVEKKAESKTTKPKKNSQSAKQAKTQAKPVESLLLIQGTKFLKVPFFFDIEKEDGTIKHFVQQKLTERPTVSSRPKVSGALDSKNLVELLSQQLEYENRTFFEGCEGQICVKCNINNVDAKYYVDRSLGYCTECAMLLSLGQSKEGVFSEAQIELMRRSMEKSIESGNDIDEDDIENALGDMDSLELEEALLAAAEEEAAGFNA